MSATRPASKTELKNYALRRLGFPAIDINVCDEQLDDLIEEAIDCLLYTSPSPRDKRQSRMPSSA